MLGSAPLGSAPLGGAAPAEEAVDTTTILIRRRLSAGPPADGVLEPGECAVSMAEDVLYYGRLDGTIAQIPFNIDGGTYA